MKKLLTIILLLAVCLTSHAVLKERDLDRTLKVLRGELTASYQESVDAAERRSEETQQIVSQLRETLRRCGQNALMLYSQQQNYVFDLTYACHEATDQLPVVYPLAKNYGRWHIFNGRLVLSELKRGTGNDFTIIGSDTADFIRLKQDTLILGFNDGERKFYRKEEDE